MVEDLVGTVVKVGGKRQGGLIVVDTDDGRRVYRYQSPKQRLVVDFWVNSDGDIVREQIAGAHGVYRTPGDRYSCPGSCVHTSWHPAGPTTYRSRPRRRSDWPATPW